VLAVAALKRPDILSDGHAVHGWTEGDTGIAGAVTDRTIGLYDFSLDGGNRPVSERTATISIRDTAYLLQIPELDQAMRDLAEVPASVLTVGLGLVAIQTQTKDEPCRLRAKLLETMEQL
jgi:hypothetical protein